VIGQPKKCPTSSISHSHYFAVILMIFYMESILFFVFLMI